MISGNYFPMDPAMDLCLLAFLQLIFSSLNLRRLIPAYLLLTLSTLVALFLPKGTSPWFIYIPFALGAAAVAVGARTYRRILEASACLFSISTAAAGFTLLSGGSPLLPALAGATLLLCLLRQRRNIRFCWNIDLSIEKDGLCASFPALIDTGNRLREHTTGLPVLIVEAAAIADLAEYASNLPKSERRTLPFGVLGGNGEITCFRCDRVLIQHRSDIHKTAPECWIAVFHGKIPGPICALAPPEFAEALEYDHCFTHDLHNKARRLCYGFFKR